MLHRHLSEKDDVQDSDSIVHRWCLNKTLCFTHCCPFDLMLLFITVHSNEESCMEKYEVETCNAANVRCIYEVSCGKFLNDVC